MDFCHPLLAKFNAGLCNKIVFYVFKNLKDRVCSWLHLLFELVSVPSVARNYFLGLWVKLCEMVYGLALLAGCWVGVDLRHFEHNKYSDNDLRHLEVRKFY
jgi:hypothetical protein